MVALIVALITAYPALLSSPFLFSLALDVLPACEQEDATNVVCKWDASEQGVPPFTGTDFIVVGDEVHYLSR